MRSRWFFIALVTGVVLLSGEFAHGQVFGSSSDSNRVRKKKERNVLDADTLPRVSHRWETNGYDADTVKAKRSRKEKRPRMDTVSVFDSSTYSVITHPGDSVEVTKPRRERKTEKPSEPVYIDWDTAQQTPLTPDQVAAMLLDSGNHYLNKNNYGRAVVFFDSLINHYPNTFQHRVAYYFRGKARMALNADIPAMVDLNAFNTMDKCQSSFCTDAHYSLAVLKFRNDRIAECLNELNWVFKDSTYKNYKYAFFYRGFCKASQEQYIPAIQDLTRFVELDGGRTFSSAEALYYRGFYKAQLSDNRGAIRDYDEAIKLYEAGASAKGGQYQQKLIDTYVVRALAKAGIKKYDEAIADYDIVIRLNPKYATAYRLKGLAEIGKGDKDNGCLDLSRAGELGSNEAYDDIKQHCR